MRTIRPWTREDRRHLAEDLALRLVEWFGDRLLALAVQASVARGDDGSYSDLELVAIVREGSRGGAGVLHEGMLIEIEWMTEAEWLTSCRSVTKSWHAAGSSRLAHLAGDAELIGRLDRAPTTDLEADCRKQATAKWHEVQESTAKVLTALERDNRESLGLLAWMMVLDMLGVVSLLNETPYTTLASFIPEARRLPHQPERFCDLLDVFSQGRCAEDRVQLRALIVDVIDSFEAMYDQRGIPLGEDDLDRLKPADA